MDNVAENGIDAVRRGQGKTPRTAPMARGRRWGGGGLINGEDRSDFDAADREGRPADPPEGARGDDDTTPERGEAVEHVWKVDLAPDGCWVPFSYALLRRCRGRKRRVMRLPLSGAEDVLWI